jgi:nucleoside-diphosphate-sugar epimerase
MNILVVGGAGYVGGALTDALLWTERDDIVVYDALLYEESYRKHVPFVNGDIRDTDRLSEWIEWADVVVWLAALVGDGACELHPSVSDEINALPLRWYSKKYPKKRIIFTSTCSVYGWHEGLVTEDTPFNPQSVYAATKIAAEEFLGDCENALILRLGTLFGVGDDFSRIRLDLVVNTMTTKAYVDGQIHIHGGGTQQRPLLHVADIASLISQHTRTATTGVYNLAQTNVSMIELANQIQFLVPDTQIVYQQIPVVDKRSYMVSWDKAKKDLGFRPQLDVTYGVTELYQLLKDGRIKDLDNPRYTNQKYLSTFNTHLEW